MVCRKIIAGFLGIKRNTRILCIAEMQSFFRVTASSRHIYIVNVESDDSNVSKTWGNRNLNSQFLTILF